MWPVTEQYVTEARRSHFMLAEVEARRGDGVTLLDFDSGHVTLDYDASSRFALDLSVKIDGYDFDDMRALLDPDVTTLAPFRGISTDLIPLGEHYITEAEPSDEGVWRVTAYDASVRCQSALASALALTRGTSTHVAAAQILKKAFPAVRQSLPVSDAFTVPSLVITQEDDPWSKAQQIEADAGFQLAADRLGVITATPRVISTAGNPVWAFVEGANAEFFDPQRTLRADDYPNQVVVLGTNPTAAGVSGFARDEDPRSPTYWRGVGGLRTKVIKSSRVITSEQAASAAALYLSLLLGPQDEVEFKCVPNAALDLGDVITVTRERIGLVDSKMIITYMEIPLVATDAMTVRARRGIFTDQEGLPV